MSVICFDRFTDSHWQSCRTIKSNIKKSLNIASNDIEYLSISECEGSYRIQSLCEKIKNQNINKIIFLEHQYIPLEFICFFKKYKQFKTVDFYFFIYGDFTLNLNSWQSLAQNLIGCKVKLLVASHAQRKLVSKVVDGEIEVVPFPVDSTVFYYNEDERLAFRQRLGLSDEIIFYYSGRISEQKNVMNMIHSFLNIKKYYFKNAKLFISGNYDDIGKAFFGKKRLPGHYYQIFQEQLSEVDSEYLGDIQFFDFVPHEQTSLLYTVSDFYLSLSSFHDEDYGMSIGEALLSGLPALITDWGGYSSFVREDFKKYLQLVSVKLTSSGPAVKYNEVLKKFLLLHANSKSIDRNRFSQLCQSHFSIDSVAKRYNDLIFSSDIKNPLVGLGFWAEVINRYDDGNTEIFHNDDGITNFYKDMYNDYR